MGANFRREFTFGIVSLFIFAILLIFYTIRYNNQSSIAPSLSGSASSLAGIVLSNNEISKHNNPSNCWLIIENKVYDATNFLSRHPGGGGLITPYCGQDATQPFLTKDGRGSHSQQALQLLGLLYLGDINGKVKQQPDKNSIQNATIKNGEGEND